MGKNIEIEGYEIIVIQSLEKNDLKTGEELFNDILRYKQIVRNDIITKYYSVSTRKEFEELLVRIEKEIPSDHILTIHLETHGCNEGIGLSSRELISWKDFFLLFVQ